MSYPDAYCVKCGKHTPTQQKHTVLLQNSARALKGVCPDCASEVYKILPKGKAFRTTVDREEAARQPNYPSAFCVRCQAHTETVKPHTLFLENGSRAVTGTCAKCGSEVYRILGNKKEKGAKSEAKVTPLPDMERRIANTRRIEPLPVSRSFSKALACGIILGMIAAGVVLLFI